MGHCEAGTGPAAAAGVALTHPHGTASPTGSGGCCPRKATGVSGPTAGVVVSTAPRDRRRGQDGRTAVRSRCHSRWVVPGTHSCPTPGSTTTSASGNGASDSASDG
jgi:hypothetical protein